MGDKISRRDLIKTGGAALGLSAIANAESKPKSQSMIGVAFEKREKVRMGIIGVGARGLSMIDDFIGIDGLEIKALCDNVKESAEAGAAKLQKSGFPAPAIYTKGDYAFEELCKRDDLDLIYIATPWEWHAPMASSAMLNGKHVGVEVPMATTMKELWNLVDISEKTRKHCIMLENCCYGNNEMLVLNMVRDGVFGELTHGEAAYIHDLRIIVNENRSEGLWRRAWHTRKNANLYPTHGLGPVANYMDINRGDKFDYLVSVSSPVRSLNTYREKTEAKDSAKWKEKYICGDMNTSIIKTNKGLSIMLQHDVSTPRPYDRLNLIQGTKGTFRDYPARLYLDGQEGGHRWADLSKVKAKYEHDLWKRMGEIAKKIGGHGGMDFIMFYRLVEQMKGGLIPDMDVYDGASWSAPFPMSEESVAKGSMPVKFPDFTRGRWSEKRINMI